MRKAGIFLFEGGAFLAGDLRILLLGGWVFSFFRGAFSFIRSDHYTIELLWYTHKTHLFDEKRMSLYEGVNR
jgi:hypothetical protein